MNFILSSLFKQIFKCSNRKKEAFGKFTESCVEAYESPTNLFLSFGRIKCNNNCQLIKKNECKKRRKNRFLWKCFTFVSWVVKMFPKVAAKNSLPENAALSELLWRGPRLHEGPQERDELPTPLTHWFRRRTNTKSSSWRSSRLHWNKYHQAHQRVPGFGTEFWTLGGILSFMSSTQSHGKKPTCKKKRIWEIKNLEFLEGLTELKLFKSSLENILVQSWVMSLKLLIMDDLLPLLDLFCINLAQNVQKCVFGRLFICCYNASLQKILLLAAVWQRRFG